MASNFSSLLLLIITLVFLINLFTKANLAEHKDIHDAKEKTLCKNENCVSSKPLFYVSDIWGFAESSSFIIHVGQTLDPPLAYSRCIMPRMRQKLKFQRQLKYITTYTELMIVDAVPLINSKLKSLGLVTLDLAGDVEVNPGPGPTLRPRVNPRSQNTAVTTTTT